MFETFAVVAFDVFLIYGATKTLLKRATTFLSRILIGAGALAFFALFVQSLVR